ncbi:glycosyltransferase family 4 protein [Aestuariivirga sp.]|uniref:glycosyltransferase family 4 protein n=1 Tax=Aestuariivirga sp. TaxID=2650926 RepID=UPI00391BC222
MRNASGSAPGALRVLLATPYGEDGMGGIDRLNDAIVDGFARRPELGVASRRLVTRGKGSLWAAQPVFAGALAQLAWLALRREADLLHIHLSVRGSSYRKAILAKLARALGLPYVLHLHGTDYRDFWAGTKGPVRSELDRMFAGSARILVLGEFWAKVVSDLQPESAPKVAVLPNATAAAEPRAHHGSSGSGVCITFLGQLGWRKGSADLLKALALLRHVPDWTATLAGDGAVTETRQAVRELGLDGRVSVPGWIGTGKRTELLAGTDIVVLPSYAENLPMVILEAFASGVATVTTPVGAIPEVVENERNGLLVPPGDVTALAAAIERLVRDPAFRRRLGVAAWQDHATKFEIEGYLERLCALWHEAVAERSHELEKPRAAL